MARKRKSHGHAPSGPRPFDAADGNLGPVNTFEDVADSEDEFHVNRDKVLLDEGPEAKRRRKWQEKDDLLEPSDEEVLGYSSNSEDDNNDVEIDDVAEESKAQANGTSDSEVEGDEEDAAGWGTSKKDYYNADNIETEADALEEEAEAKRLQQKRLQKMSEADFGFDENEWQDLDDKDEEGDVVTEVLREVEITPEMGTSERLQLLHTRYPEFESLANEFVQLQPLFEKSKADGARHENEVDKIKRRALGAYMGALTMYFAILTSTAKIGDGKSSAFNSADLHDHGIMESLLQCRETWRRAKSLKAPRTAIVDSEEIISRDDDYVESSEHIPVKEPIKKSKRALVEEAAANKAVAIRAERIRAAEIEVADLSTLIPKPGKSSKPKITKTIPPTVDDDSDFGEEESLDARSAVQKAAKKKSLRFYTSQISQKANKRADAGRDAGGDADLPYRERLKDRQARLNAEAEKRGKKLDENGRGADLGADSGSDGEETALAVRDGADDYYDMVAKTSKRRKEAKSERYEAMAAAKAVNSSVRVVEGEVGEDGKRAIGYVIEKNKGLAPKRKKDVRNPRVKKRKMYEAKKKKLSSIRAVYKGGEERGGYGGQKTGIKTGLVKSIKL